jgi:electron transport complex protein RnfC
VESYGLSACIECGCCDYVCPSHIPLVDWFRFGKGELRKRARENEAAELARKRFEEREARLIRIKQERAEKMQRRKQLLKDKALQQDRIKASIQRAENKTRARAKDPGEAQDGGQSHDS